MMATSEVHRTPGEVDECLTEGVSAIPSLFGQLVYISSVPGQRNLRHERPAALRRHHQDIFESWLCLGLEQQLADLTGYVSTCPENRSVLRTVVSTGLYQGLIPPGAMGAQRDLFTHDLAVVLFLLNA